VSDLGLLTLLGLTGATFAGAVAQRSTGMGFALLASPFLTLVLGPFEGILVTNVAGTIAAALNLSQVWRDVEWKRALVLVPTGVLGVVPGALVVLIAPSAPLMIGVSSVVIVGLASTLLLRGRSLPNSRALATTGGLASGFMNVTAGVGGPGVVVYARTTAWPHRHFAATAQLHFLALGIASLAAKRALPSLPAIGWAALAAALVAGLLMGNRLALRIEAALAMRIVMIVAVAGAAVALARGVADLL